MEDWKIKIAVLWFVFESGALVSPILELYLPGFVEGIIAGKTGGSEITPALLLVLAIGSLIPPVMAFLSLTLKDSMNRWANIILGIVFAGFALLYPIEFLTNQSAYFASLILTGIVQFVVAALIVWYAWKSKQKA